jgi:hypothetical protein
MDKGVDNENTQITCDKQNMSIWSHEKIDLISLNVVWTEIQTWNSCINLNKMTSLTCSNVKPVVCGRFGRLHIR